MNDKNNIQAAPASADNPSTAGAVTDSLLAAIEDFRKCGKQWEHYNDSVKDAYDYVVDKLEGICASLAAPVAQSTAGAVRTTGSDYWEFIGEHGFNELNSSPKNTAAPLFWYRPIGRDGLYEGPVHNNSVDGKLLREEKPDEWVALYAANKFDQVELMRLVREYAEVVYGHRRTTEDTHKKLIDYVASVAAPALNPSEVRDQAPVESATDAAMQRACRDLPEFYQVIVEMENGCGCVVWNDKFGASHDIEGEGFLSDDINRAIDEALEHAAQQSALGEKGGDHV